MKASINTKYGPPEILEIMEVSKPVPKDNEVLIKIHATTVNRTDCGFRKPEYLIVRLIAGLFQPRKTILGNELAGEIEVIGKEVKSFKPGNKVFGLSTYNFGTHAEYICLPEKASIYTMPVNMTYEQAASVCDGMMLGMNLIKEIDFKKVPEILINGASGSIGTACVQLAHQYGAKVTAVCNTSSFDLVKSLGATEVIDFTKEDFTRREQDYDYIIDAVGKSSFFKCRKLLKPGGVYFSTELGSWSQNVILALLTPLLGGKKVKFPIPVDKKEDIILYKKMIEEGKYIAVIDRKYPLEKIVEATTYVETGQKTGNVVITMM